MNHSLATPELIVAPDRRQAARQAAEIVERYVRSTPDPVLGLATGGTMVGVYAELVERHRGAGLSFARCRAFLLDEYVGLDAVDPNAYSNVIAREFAGRVDLAPSAVLGPDAWASDPAAVCLAYDDAVRSAGVGVQLLGIGRNGHLAFNEPGSAFDSRTRVVVLSPTTRADNARYFPSGSSPARAITQGLGTIMQARHLVLVALGSPKAEALHAALHGPIGQSVPASVVRLHPRVTVIADPPAARLLLP